MPSHAGSLHTLSPFQASCMRITLATLERAPWVSTVDHSASPDPPPSEPVVLRAALADATAWGRERTERRGKDRVCSAGSPPTQSTRTPPRDDTDAMEGVAAA